MDVCILSIFLFVVFVNFSLFFIVFSSFDIALDPYQLSTHARTHTNKDIHIYMLKLM